MGGGGGGGGGCYLSDSKPKSVSHALMSKGGADWKCRGEDDPNPTCAAWGPASSGAISSTLACVHDL